MARARTLKPDFFDDEKLAAIPLGARLVFQSLWCLADREGRLQDRPLKIAAFAFPYELRYQKQVPAWLDDLVANRFVIRYQVDGAAYLWLPKFLKHQKPHPHEAASLFPPIPDIGNTCNDIGDTSNEMSSGLSSLRTLKPSESGEGSPMSRPTLANVENELRHFAEDHPDVDVQREFLKFRDWLASKGKSYKDYRAAFRNWLRKVNEYADKPASRARNGEHVQDGGGVASNALRAAYGRAGPPEFILD